MKPRLGAMEPASWGNDANAGGDGAKVVGYDANVGGDGANDMG